MKSKSEDSGRWSVVGALGAALAAAVCCLGPLILVSLGVTGAWIGNLSALEAYRPAFMAVAAGLLGFGFYRVYGRSQPKECSDEAECEVPKANRINQISIWIATVVVAALFASPYVLGIELDDEPGTPDVSASAADETGTVDLSTVTLTVQKMTCEGCARSVQTALTGIDGVEDARVTFDPPEARVTYDASRVSVEELANTTAEIGYPSKPGS